MAKVELEFPIAGIHGRVHHNSESYCANRLGKTVISNYPKHKDPTTISPLQHTFNSRFAQAVALAKTELADPTRRAYWQSLFDQQPQPRRYQVLRNFVIAQLTKQN